MKFLIEEKLANNILNYLATKPYIEVANLIHGLNSLVPVQEIQKEAQDEAPAENVTTDDKK